MICSTFRFAREHEHHHHHRDCIVVHYFPAACINIQFFREGRGGERMGEDGR